MNTQYFFDSYFNHAEINCIMIMDCDGTILRVNKAFTKNYGYTNEDLVGKYFNMLFTTKDKEQGKPELELQTVLKLTQSHDENYVVDKNGVGIWSTGETVLVDGGEGKQYVVKDIINLQSKRQLQLFLNQTEELLERVFESSKEIAMMIVDGSMKVLKANEAFGKLFRLPDLPAPGSRLGQIEHPFWKNTTIRSELTNVLITNHALRDRKYLVQENGEDPKAILINTRIIEGNPEKGKRVFIIIDDVTDKEGG
jgi:PAS domain S-box-containing protein